MFNFKKKYVSVETYTQSENRVMPKDNGNTPFELCKKCKSYLTKSKLKQDLYVCSECSFHFPISSLERIDSLVDEGSFVQLNEYLTSIDPISFPDYKEKLEKAKKVSGLNEAVVTGKASIDGTMVTIGVMDSRFMMGSMGSAVGEKITRAIEFAIEHKTPFILFAASGGARMQEGILSLMQMAKTSIALDKLHQEGLLFLSILTNPTTGGVSASFASLGDLNIAEPGALIGFAGRRIIEQTIREELPENFQTAEFLLEKGQIDLIVDRRDMRNTLETLLKMHQ